MPEESNSSRSRTWKLHLQELADELGMAITVLPLPTRNKQVEQIEHRLFSFISLTWKGQPLINYETVVNLIGATKTKERATGEGQFSTPTSTKRASK